jgi:Ferric reductase NAD binding domain
MWRLLFWSAPVLVWHTIIPDSLSHVWIGVTPFASILKHIWYRQRSGHLGSLRRVEFFWICRDTPSFGWFQSLLQEVEAAQADRKSSYVVCANYI